MRAITVQQFGGPQVLTPTEIEDVAPRPGEVLIRTRYADVMYLDTQLRAGWGQDFFDLTLPYVPGGAVGGEIVAVGAGVDPARIGEMVIARTAASGIGSGQPIGGYAELARARDEGARVLPPGVDLVTATAIVHDGQTAQALLRSAAVRPGETVLVTAAGGGVGVLLVQLLRAAGATVFAAASQRKQELLTRLGPDISVDYTEPEWTAALPTRPEVVIDGAGGRYGAAALAAVAPGGRYLGFGAADGAFAQDSGPQRGDITSTSLLEITGDPRLDWGQLNAAALHAVADGTAVPCVGQTFALDQARAAHAAIAARETIGRTLLWI